MQTRLPETLDLWLVTFGIVGLIIYALASHLFFRKNLIWIEFYLAEIDTVCINQWFYGPTRFGKRMRRGFIALILIRPELFKKQEHIPRYKIEKLPSHLRFWTILFYLIDLTLMALLIAFAVYLEVSR